MLGIGIDAVDIARFRLMLQRRPELQQRLFTPAECAALAQRSDATASLAARFAVREATMKSLGVGLGAFDFHDVSVHTSDGGAPRLLVVGRAAEIAKRMGVTDWRVSISHTETLAMAVVAAL